MVSVSEGVIYYIPSVVVTHHFFINLNAQQLYGSDRRVGVIKLDLILSCELRPVVFMIFFVAPNNVAHRCRAEEVLLLQTKLLAALT